MNQSEVPVLKKLIQDLKDRIAQQERKLSELQSLVDQYHQGVAPIHSVRSHAQNTAQQPFADTARSFCGRYAPLLVSLCAAACAVYLVITRWWGYDQSIMLYGVGLAFYLAGLYAHQGSLIASAYGVWLYATLYSFYVMFFYPEIIVLSPLVFYAAVGVGLLAFVVAALLTVHHAQGRSDGRNIRYLVLGMSAMPLFWILAMPLPEPYILVALIGYALALFLAGAVYGLATVRQCAYGVGACFVVIFVHYLTVENFLDSQFFFSFNVLCIVSVFMSIIAYEFAARLSKNLTAHEQHLVPRVLQVAIICLVYVWLRACIITRLSAADKPGLILARIWGDYDMPADLIRSAKTNNALAAFYGIYAMVVMCVSFMFRSIWLGRLALIGLVIAGIKFFLVMPTISGLGLGVAFVAIAFFAGMYWYRVASGKY